MTKKNKSLDESLIKRILLLKYSLGEAQKYLKETFNEYAFSTGVSLLHDVIENFFWAIDSFVGINLKDKQNLPDKYEVIMDERKLKGKIAFNKTSIVELNSIRNSFKHKGILPNIQQTTSIVNELFTDFNETVNRVFNLDLNSISLSVLIKNGKVKEKIQNLERKIYSEKMLTHNNYKDAIVEIGKIYFDYYERNGLVGLSILMADIRDGNEGKKKKRYIFENRTVDEIYRGFLELGMTPYYYYRFKNIVPSYGLDREKDIVVQKISSVHWGKENWTKLNTEFCLNWLIEYILRKEKVYSRDDYNIKSPTSREHIFTISEDTILELAGVAPNSSCEFCLKKGEAYLGHFFDYVGNEWQDYDEEEQGKAHFLLYCNNERYFGKIAKKMLKITEIHLDEIPLEQTNSLLISADKAKRQRVELSK